MFSDGEQTYPQHRHLDPLLRILVQYPPEQINYFGIFIFRNARLLCLNGLIHLQHPLSIEWYATISKAVERYSH